MVILYSASSIDNRTFQPVIEIAKLLGKKLNLPVNYDCLQKTKTTEIMKSNDISAKEKEKKLKGVLKLKIKHSKTKKYYYLTIFFKQGQL